MIASFKHASLEEANIWLGGPMRALGGEPRHARLATDEARWVQRGALGDLPVGGSESDQVHPVEFVADVAPCVVGGVLDHAQQQEGKPAELDVRADPVLTMVEHRPESEGTLHVAPPSFYLQHLLVGAARSSGLVAAPAGPAVGANDQFLQVRDEPVPDGGVAVGLFGVVADHEPLRPGTQAPYPLGGDLSQLVVGLVQADVVAASDLAAIADAVVVAYVAGLREEGWDGDEADVERGFCVSALLRSGFDGFHYYLLAGDPDDPEARCVFDERVALARFIADRAALLA